VCSSWISHLPKDVKYGRVVGVGMNARELEANTQLTEWVQADLNREPKLPFDDSSFDNILCVVSIDYLIRPREVVSEFHRVLRPGGRVLLSFSNRCFPTKVAQKWLSLNDDGRQRMVGSYFMYSPQVTLGGQPAWVDVGAEKLPAAKRTPVASELGGKLGSLFGSSAAIMAAALGNLGDPMYVVSATKAGVS
jgi:SAM-dependent methyltransferase